MPTLQLIPDIPEVTFAQFYFNNCDNMNMVENSVTEVSHVNEFWDRRQ